ncbi:hypothetical protein PBI_COLLEEN_6 [Corynebacterium phage Colleen]|uniref:Uncharacterized protein n=4 Tax=root TaxID=1 RepID=W5XX50_9CORY|nr:hypothetical protein [Corynebacterium vitaeruminis]YP_009626518.1 hypothetical protein FDK28_gp06 [Corynebacterium phage Poushou]AWY06454.1 hypothetical protein PBI_TOUCHMENOT_6 [Corynebacterium phage TouchMeNot]QFG14755.1 hypothetical protein PBI_COLLEEN_6 [Corynebacterium phage Colleen]UVT31892.1 hypothetical protein PBI_ARIANNA_6 [Corynebacterium phage Arianna]AHI21596.1 hypothetical protein B843_01000 [Corynebacterium vitaeruminis DSM 20294]ASJ78965.1 hypothetical protein PBI_POUSHOU_6
MITDEEATDIAEKIATYLTIESERTHVENLISAGEDEWACNYAIIYLESTKTPIPAKDLQDAFDVAMLAFAKDPFERSSLEEAMATIPTI